jgi:hypothetical protein
LADFLQLSDLTIGILQNYLNSAQTGKGVVDARALFQIAIDFIPYVDIITFAQNGGCDLV